MDLVELTVTLAACFVTVKAAGPARCSGLCQGTTQEYNACVARNATQSCATSPLGSTHCFVATGEYTDLSDQSKGSGAVSGCIDCADKAKACQRLKQALRALRNVDVTSCAIECCTTDLCNAGVDPPKLTTEPPAGHGFAATGSPFVLLAAFAVYFGF